MHSHDHVDHHCKTTGMNHGLCAGIWTPGSRRCEILHDHIMLYHVGVQVLSLHIPHKSLRLRPNGSMDRNVRRLDSTRNSIHVEIPQPAVAEAQGNLKNCRYDPKSERYFTFWKCKEKP